MNERAASLAARFALTKFQPPTLPTTLVTRPALHDRLTAGAGQRLTMVVGSAGAGKTVLLSSWAAARPPGTTSWLSCDKADTDPPRFWAGLIEALGHIGPGFGSDAVGLLAAHETMSADVVASIVNDAAKLPAGSAIVVDDFHHAAPAVATEMTHLIASWPAGTVQLVLSGRFDPSLRLHRLRMSSELCELRDRDLYFSLAESGELLAKFGVDVAAADLALLHERSEGWAAAVQMAALSLRDTRDPALALQAVEARRHMIAAYFISEVLDRQSPEVAQFMLDTSMLGELTAASCAAVTGRQDSGTLLRGIHAANLFLVALDDERATFRYHQLIRQVLRAELRARDRARELALQLRAGEWFESAGDARRAARHFLAARQPDRALALVQDRLATSFLRDPALPAPLDIGTIDPATLMDAPDQLMALAADLLLSGDTARGGEYLDLLEQAPRPSAPSGSGFAARLATVRAVRHMQAGRAEPAVAEALAARAREQLTDDWAAFLAVPLVRGYTWLEDFRAVEREAAAALAMPGLPEPVKLVMVPGAQALARFDSGYLAEAAEGARAAAVAAERLGFGRHCFAVDYLRTLAGLALEQRDLDTAERLTEQALSICHRRRPPLEFLALLDQARILAARGQVHEALATVHAAARVLASPSPVLLARADELQAELRLSLGDLRAPADLTAGLPASRRELLLAKIALASGDGRGAQEHLQAPPDEAPRRAVVRRLLLAAAAIETGDLAAAALVDGALDGARRAGYLLTLVTTAPKVTGHLIEHAPRISEDPFTKRLIPAALEARATRPRCGSAEPLTAAEQRVLDLLPTSTCPQMAATLYVSPNTVKTHLRSIYHKLGAASRLEAVERAAELRML